jgi:hypothetical protein
MYSIQEQFLYVTELGKEPPSVGQCRASSTDDAVPYDRFNAFLNYLQTRMAPTLPTKSDHFSRFSDLFFISFDLFFAV